MLNGDNGAKFQPKVTKLRQDVKANDAVTGTMEGGRREAPLSIVPLLRFLGSGSGRNCIIRHAREIDAGKRRLCVKIALFSAYSSR